MIFDLGRTASEKYEEHHNDQVPIEYHQRIRHWSVPKNAFWPCIISFQHKHHLISSSLPARGRDSFCPLSDGIMFAFAFRERKKAPFVPGRPENEETLLYGRQSGRVAALKEAKEKSLRDREETFHKLASSSLSLSLSPDTILRSWG